ncbi:MAG: Na+/H+ antiporter subunit E [Halodesulfurarchaeum sp.]
MKMRRWGLAMLSLAVIWLFVRGVPIDARIIVGELLLGLVFGGIIAYTFRRLYTGRANLSYGIRATPYAIIYIAVFLKELVVANFDVAYRVVAPSMPIEPAVLYIPLRVERPTAISTIANSITLTPGTLTMDYDEDANALYVHTINGRNPEAVVAPIRRWEDFALVIFGEEKNPGDPAPELRVGGDARGR